MSMSVHAFDELGSWNDILTGLASRSLENSEKFSNFYVFNKFGFWDLSFEFDFDINWVTKCPYVFVRMGGAHISMGSHLGADFNDSKNSSLLTDKSFNLAKIESISSKFEGWAFEENNIYDK